MGVAKTKTTNDKPDDRSRERSMEQKILETAERLFLDKGFALTSTTEIAKEAGCNQALVHYYFRTKDNLFQKIFESKVRLFGMTFLSAGRAGDTFEDKVRKIVESHFDILSANPKLPLFLINEVPRNPERFAALRQEIGALTRELFGSLDESLRAEVRKGSVRQITLFDLMYSIASINVFLFISAPIIGHIFQKNDDDMEKFMRHRKEEAVKTILSRLRP